MGLQVDFERMILCRGKTDIPIQRHFAPGLFLNYFNSADKTTIHLQVHKLQVSLYLHFKLLFDKLTKLFSCQRSTISSTIAYSQ